MSIKKEHLLQPLELRYDYYSSRAVFAQSLLATGLQDKNSYTPEEVASICVFLKGKSNTENLIENLLSQAKHGAQATGGKSAPAKAVEPELSKGSGWTELSVEAKKTKAK